MARERSDKSKTKSSKEERRAGKPEEGVSARAAPTKRTMSGNSAQRQSLPSTAGPKKRQERQRLEEETSAHPRESEKASERTTSTASTDNGHQDIEDDASMHRRIAEQAFLLFQKRGCEHGNDWDHWFEAERHIGNTHV